MPGAAAPSPRDPPHSSTVEASFLEFDGSRRFLTLWRPSAGPPREALVLAPPFGEEMNKSRRTVACSARRFAQAGFAVAVLDLLGCGDSEGHFADATWDRWCADLLAAAAHAREHFQCPTTFWSVRAGSLFLPDVHEAFDRFVLWQPVAQGENYLTQLLRMRVAADALAGGNVTTKALRAELEQGRSLEIGGYEMGPDLLLPMSRRSLDAWTPARGDVLWLETGGETEGSCSPVATRIIQRLQAAGAAAAAEWVPGDAFWMTLEIAENRALADRTLLAAERAPS